MNELRRPAYQTRFNRLQTAIVLVIFFLSGTAGLIYEISWSRQIGLLFGHTIHAASVVLASWFVGMAVGYLIGARWSSRVNPLLGYALAEILVAMWAVLIPVLLSWFETPELAGWLSHPSFAWQITIRAVFGFLLLLPATAAMGATLPLIAQHFSPSSNEGAADDQRASRVTRAYAINTLGAFVGVCLATGYLLVYVGVRSSSYLAAGLSALSALVALVLWGLAVRTDKGQLRMGNVLPAPAANVIKRSEPRSWKIGLFLSAISGFGTLALQVLYTRMFSLVFHNSTYTFGIVVAVFIVSLAIGAVLAGWLQSRGDERFWIGIASGLGAMLTTISVIVFSQLTDLDYFGFGKSFVTYMLGTFLLVSVVVGPGIVCLGTILPLTWKLAARDSCSGRVVGNLTAVNSLAAAAGAIGSSFVLLPWIGLWGSVVLIAAVFLFAAVIVFPEPHKMRWVICSGLGLLMTSVLALNAPVDSLYNRSGYEEQLVRRWNSAYGWIDLVQRKNSNAFKIRQNLHYRFGTTGINAREFRQAHIPLLLHGEPEDVLFLGLGTGLTAGGAVPHPNVRRIAAVELIPEVVEAAEMLREHNFGIVGHPKATVHVDDARHHLFASPTKYDVIVSDLFVPWESESGYLYTVEHYEAAAARLKPDGMFCQWLPLYQLGTREFEMIANSFADVFPNTTLWWGQVDKRFPVIALIGTEAPLKIDSGALDDRIDNLKKQLRSIDPNVRRSERLLGLYMGDWIKRPNAILNTDEHPRVEFFTPMSHRNREMIRDEVLQRYYDSVLAKLPADGLEIDDKSSSEVRAFRAPQRQILFGKVFNP